MGANDPIYTSFEPMSDVLVAAITTSIALTLSDRTAGGILTDPNISAGFLDTAGLRGALADKVVDIAWGVDEFAAVAQGSNFSILDLASDSASVALARYGFGRTVSDMARLFDSWGITQWANFASDATMGWQRSALKLLTALFPSFGGSGGATGAAATWAGIVNDMQTLAAADVPGPYTLVTRPKDWSAVSADAMSLGGFVAQDSETAGYRRAANAGFKGVFMGGDLRVYTSQHLPTSGGDTVSGMFGRGAMIWDAKQPAPSPSTIPLLWTPVFGVEIARTALKSEDNVVNSTHMGASVHQAAAGVAMPFLT